MPLCGSSFCGCAVTSVPADFAEIGGTYPSIDVAGNGTGASPWNLTLNDEWAGVVADAVNRDVTRYYRKVFVCTGVPGVPTAQTTPHPLGPFLPRRLVRASMYNKGPSGEAVPLVITAVDGLSVYFTAPGANWCSLSIEYDETTTWS